ncbi:MAG: hypothetical protein Q9221_005794 [Calogaya cf. arnoldii]
MTRLEDLTSELIEMTFFESLNPNFPRASPSLAKALSAPAIKTKLVTLAFSGVAFSSAGKEDKLTYHDELCSKLGLDQDGASEPGYGLPITPEVWNLWCRELDQHAGTFREWLDSIDAGSANDEANDEADTTEAESEEDNSEQNEVDEVEEEEEEEDPEEDLAEDFEEILGRKEDGQEDSQDTHRGTEYLGLIDTFDEDSLECNLVPTSTFIARTWALEAGPSKTVVDAGALVGDEHKELARQGLMDAIEQDNHRAVDLLAARSCNEQCTDCFKNDGTSGDFGLEDTFAEPYIGDAEFDFHYSRDGPSILDWIEERKKIGDEKGQWLEELLDTCADLQSEPNPFNNYADWDEEDWENERKWQDGEISLRV